MTTPIPVTVDNFLQAETPGRRLELHSPDAGLELHGAPRPAPVEVVDGSWTLPSFETVG